MNRRMGEWGGWTEEPEKEEVESVMKPKNG